METFNIEKEFLKGLLHEVDKGDAQLPDFQRGWVWPEQNIGSLLASISLGYPVGTVMMLQAGGGVRFLTRPVEGVKAPGARPDRLILDGQQRLTSLYQSLLRREPVVTDAVKNKKGNRGWFYLDMAATLDPNVDREDAVVFVPEDKVRKNFRGEPTLDLSTPEAEYAHRMFPCTSVFESMPWMMGFLQANDSSQEAAGVWQRFWTEVVQRFEQYQVPVIELGKHTPRQAVCQVFEKVNTGGVTLTVFELLTATYAAEEFQLRDDWNGRQNSWSDPRYRVLAEVSDTDFLQAVALLATYGRRQAAIEAGIGEDKAPRIGCRRVDMLDLRLADYQRWAPVAADGLRRASKFLHSQGIFDTRYLPYGSQLIPLAAILTTLGHQADTVAARNTIARWYWCGVFGELYGGTTETRFARDLPDVVTAVRGGRPEPRTVQEAQFFSSRLWSMRTRQSAAYKGLYSLLLRGGALDWRTGGSMSEEDYFEDAVDIHHIFPKAWCEKNGIEPADYNSILNKTPLTARTNRVIGGYAPSEYLGRLARGAQTDLVTIERHVSSHLVNPKHLRRDRFEDMVRDRESILLDLIGTAMGKAAQRDVDLF